MNQKMGCASGDLDSGEGRGVLDHRDVLAHSPATACPVRRHLGKQGEEEGGQGRDRGTRVASALAHDGILRPWAGEMRGRPAVGGIGELTFRVAGVGRYPGCGTPSAGH
jgi:hypothetical protein